MDFYETPLFTNRVLALLDDDSYGALQWELANRPNAGAVIVHGGGWRKIRWAAQGRGKRGGVRVIYYWWTAESRILMGNIYSKNEKENLSARELKNLRKQIEK